MTAITVANIEYEIIADIKTALTDATAKGKRVWKTVVVSLSEQEALETRLSQNTPVAAIVYETTEEALCVENVPNLEVPITLLLATKVRGSGDDTSKLKEGLRLMNAAKNVIESDLPASTNEPTHASAGGDENHYHAQIAWGNPSISKPSDDERPPWVVVRLPVTIGAVIETTTSH